MSLIKRFPLLLAGIIFTVLVTFLLMTAVFSRTMILELNLPVAATEFREPPPGLQLEVIVRKDSIEVTDRNSGLLAPLPKKGGRNNAGRGKVTQVLAAVFQAVQIQRAVWQQEGPYAKGQPLGEGVVHFCLRILTLQGVVCFAPRAGNKAPFVLVDEWLGRPIAAVDPDAARAELLRRYLRCYGPSTRAHFGAWLGVNAGDVGPGWDALADELTPVRFGGRAWVLTEDLASLERLACWILPM